MTRAMVRRNREGCRAPAPTTGVRLKSCDADCKAIVLLRCWGDYLLRADESAAPEWKSKLKELG